MLVYNLKKFRRNSDGATAVEFAFIMPVLLLISFGIMEFVAVFFTNHRINEATRIIARNLAISVPLVSEATLIADNMHVCSDATCPGIAGIIADALPLLPDLTASDVEISYEVKDLGGIGYSVGYKPLIVVNLTAQTYDFIILGAFPGIPTSVALNPSKTSILGKWY